MKDIISKILTTFTLLMVLAIFSGCMEDINEPVEARFNITGDLISYSETNGDFINSEENPALISAEELQGNLNICLLLDIRDPSEFSSGHIEGAINIEISKLIDTLESKNIEEYNRIVIVSKTGQKAAYATTMLRYYGFEKVYSLDFGMGQWNSMFAEPWISARDDAENWWSFTTQYYSKPNITKILPSVNFENPSLPTKELLQSRIKSLLSEDEYQKSLGTVAELDEDFQIRYSKFASIFVLCYSRSDLYNLKRYFKDAAPPVTWGGHFRSVPWYNPDYDFSASTNLLSLPIDRPIYIYSYNGQRSQFIVAYLRLLGYDARSVMFGAIGMLYNKLEFWKFDESFKEEAIKNYPVVN